MDNLIASNGAVIKVVGGAGGYGHMYHNLELVSGEWPADKEILEISDGWRKAPLGGRIEFRTEKTLRAVVYTD